MPSLNYAAAHSQKIIGFMSIDPNDPGAIEELSAPPTAWPARYQDEPRLPELPPL